MFGNDWDENPPEVALRRLLEVMEREKVQLSPALKDAYEKACSSFGYPRWPVLTRGERNFDDIGKSITVTIEEDEILPGCVRDAMKQLSKAARGHIKESMKG
ncbi:MAG: hypothetical protein QM390_05725 [Candidatus Thermoplasmatota archaeon]|nr:hypothetical protein [Candidatus Thermoplasmatota archaeon]